MSRDSIPGTLDWRTLDDGERLRTLARADATTLCRRAASAVRAAAEGEARARHREALAACHALLADALATLEDLGRE
jgi:hypothetical protein